MKFSIFPNSQILILFFLLRPLARHLMPLLVASIPRASIRNQNVPYRTTRRRQNIHYSLFIQGISRSIYATGKIFLALAGHDYFINHYSLNFVRSPSFSRRATHKSERDNLPRSENLKYKIS